MQRYVASRPMFMDLEVMNKDVRTMLGAEGHLVHVDEIMSGLTFVYKEIAGTTRIHDHIDYLPHLIMGYLVMSSIKFIFLCYFVTESVQAEAKTVAAVFPSPASVMSILVQVSSLQQSREIFLFSKRMATSYWFSLHLKICK